MRWGNKKLSSGVIVFVLVSVLGLAVSSFLMWKEISGYKFPEMQSEPEEKSKTKRGRR